MNTKRKLCNQYILRSKDIPLIEFSLYAEPQEAFGVIQNEYSIEIDRVHKESFRLFPKSLSGQLGSELMAWINKRKAPKNRQFVDKLLAAIEDDDNPLKYVDVSHALSLNDAYWITNKLDRAAWKDFNLYAHPMDKVLSYVAFTGHTHKVHGLTTTAELTSNGMLKKCWSNRDDGIYLIKGDDFIVRSDGRSQAMSEYYAAQVAETIGLPHIDYDLEKFTHKTGSKEIVCTCKLFTSEDKGFIDMGMYLKSSGYQLDDMDISSLKTQKIIAQLYGQDAYADLMVFDTIIGNVDRHLGNFGMLVDNNTGDILGPAPVFDNGYSLLYGAAQGDLHDGYDDYVNAITCKFFGINQQAKIFVNKRQLPWLRHLLQFTFVRHPKYNVAEETLKVMERFIRYRAQKALELYQQKNNEE